MIGLNEIRVVKCSIVPLLLQLSSMCQVLPIFVNICLKLKVYGHKKSIPDVWTVTAVNRKFSV